MATGSRDLMPTAATLPDGSSNNLPAVLRRVQGTNSDPKRHFFTLDYPDGSDTHAWWTFFMPEDYASGGSFDVYWIANATSGSARFALSVGAVTAGDADTLLEHAQNTASGSSAATNATEAYRVNVTTYTPNMDSAAADDVVTVVLTRDGDGTAGTDDLTVDARVVGVRFTYTTT